MRCSRLYAFVLCAVFLPLASCQDRSVEVKVESGMKVHDISIGRGVAAREGHQVDVHYEGRLPDGSVVVSTFDNDKSHRFIIGDGTVIVGMDEAVRGMKAGGVREVSMSPRLHYGTNGYGDKIPPKTTMTFRIEMLRVGG